MDSQTALFAGLSLVPFVLYFFIYFKMRRRRLSRVDHVDDVLIGTHEDRVEAERRASALPSDMRVKYADTMDVLERVSTRQGFSESYMEDCARSLRDRGINCEVFFQPGMIPGAADSFLQQQGLFELWVDRTKLDEARVALAKHRQ